MSAKRKRVVLSMADKVKIIEQLNKGFSGRHLADIFGVGVSTISEIKKNSASILNFVSDLANEDGSSTRKMMRTARNNDLETAVFKWFVQQRSLGNRLSGPLICEKAKVLAKKIGDLHDFKASTGWLRNFKDRHGIRELELVNASFPTQELKKCREKLSECKEDTDNCVKTFKLESKDYDSDFVYNADETSLNWKALPPKMVHSTKESISEVMKERVTVLACANSTGNHRLSLFLIGNSREPKAFNNVANLPLIYKYQENAWMTIALFLAWFDDVFVPEVKKYQQEVGKSGNVLLVLRSAPTHPSGELLEREDGYFKALFLPSDTLSFFQPMDQGIIEYMKRHYRRQLLYKLLMADGNEEGSIALCKQLNLKDFSYMIADSWISINNRSLRRAWNKINGISTEEQVQKKKGKQDEVDEEISLVDVQKVAVEVPGCSECSVEDVREWLCCDSIDQGFLVLSDEQIVEEVKVEVHEENFDADEPEVQPTVDEAFACLGTVLKWMESQPECDAAHLLAVSRVRDIAERKKRLSRLLK